VAYKPLRTTINDALLTWLQCATPVLMLMCAQNTPRETSTAHPVHALPIAGMNPIFRGVEHMWRV
jgi:hypothetical protein